MPTILELRDALRERLIRARQLLEQMPDDRPVSVLESQSVIREVRSSAALAESFHNRVRGCPPPTEDQS